MLLWIAKNDLPMLPKHQFSICLITWASLTLAAFTIALRFTMAWLYIKPIREVGSNEPTGDPVDSDPTSCQGINTRFGAKSQCWADGLVLARLSYPYIECWPFSPVLPVRMRLTFRRCGLSSTYHLIPLACWYRETDRNSYRTDRLRQYDIKPTRRYHSVMLIHDSLDTEAFSTLLSTIYHV